LSRENGLSRVADAVLGAEGNTEGALSEHGPCKPANHPNSGTVIRCLTITIQDAVALNIALELIMPGRPSRYLDEQIKQPTASRVGVEARP
jgi:hypothetical protein